MVNTLRWKNVTDNTEFLIEYDDWHIASITVFLESEEELFIPTEAITVLPNKYYFGIVARRETFFLHITEDRTAYVSAPHHNFLNFAGIKYGQKGAINSIFIPCLDIKATALQCKIAEADTDTIENSSQKVLSTPKVRH